MKVALGLGSNVGDRIAFLEDATFHLRKLATHILLSSVYESEALLPEGAPEAWNTPYLNMALVGETLLTPHTLLAEIKALEMNMGRQMRGVWGPREIDIDILLYGDAVLDEAELKIPHPHLLSRDFALTPLAEIAPDWAYPTGDHKGKTLKELADMLSKQPPLHRFLQNNRP